MKIKHISRYIWHLPKSLLFCLLHLPFKVAIKVPILVSNRVKLKSIKGRITINSNISPFMIRIGFGDVGIFDRYYIRSVWENNGKIIFEGKANIGHGSKICVGEQGELILGNNFIITANSTLVCFDKIKIGDNTLLSWDILIMDTDFHKIYEDEKLINPNQEIIIGEKVWIGCRVLILKGTIIPDGAVIAANTTISKKYFESNCLLMGNPVKVERSNIYWEE